MKKCKVCGKIFQYHVPNSHLEEHGLTRKQYNELPENDNLFFIPKAVYSETEDMIRSYIISSTMKNRKKDPKKFYGMNKEVS